MRAGRSPGWVCSISDETGHLPREEPPQLQPPSPEAGSYTTVRHPSASQGPQGMGGPEWSNEASLRGVTVNRAVRRRHGARKRVR